MGALWSAGLTPDEIEQATSRTRWRGLVRPTRSRLGLFSLRNLSRTLERLCGVKRLEDLPVPLSIWATDLATGEGVILREGELGQCCEASCAIPGVFAPVKIDGRMLVDGGVISNLPLHILNRGPKLSFVLAVDPIAKLKLSNQPRNPLQVSLQSFLIHLRATGPEVSGKCRYRVVVATPETEGINALNLRQLPHLAQRGYDEMQRVLSQNRKLFGLR